MTTSTSQPLPKDSDWLLPFVGDLSRTSGHVLEIGCGPGMDASTLMRHGFEVTAFDRAPLERARANAPEAKLLRADLSRQLPFRDGTFDAAISSLALHYLPWNATLEAFAEVRRVVRRGAEFLFRVNADDDFNHGAGEGKELERGFYRTPRPFHSETKRFFDEAMVRAALEGRFEILHLEHKTIFRYAEPKRVWECLAKADGR